MAATILSTVAGAAIPAFLRSETGQKLMRKVGLDSSMFSPAPHYDYYPSPYHTSPSMDMYQRDYVSQNEMNYMGPVSVNHLQQASRNTQSIHVLSRKTIRKLKKAKKGKKK